MSCPACNMILCHRLWRHDIHLNLIMTQRHINIEGVINFRDLGGYQNDQGQVVVWGSVFRSAQLDRLTADGIAKMADMRIQTVVDLRFSEETAMYPTVFEAVPGAEVLSWHDEHLSAEASKTDVGDRSLAMKQSWRDSLETHDPVQVREAMRVNYPKKLYSHREIYRKMLLRLIEGQTPLVFHCAAGKDRTGVAAALILSLLGVSNQVIVDDYLLTQAHIANLLDSWLVGGATDQQEYGSFQQRFGRYERAVVQPIFDADISYINTLLDYVDQTYGTFNNYALEVLDLSEQQIQTLRDNLLS